jgi:hypothetical protein
MAGGERPHLNRNEAAEQHIKDAQNGDQQAQERMLADVRSSTERNTRNDSGKEVGKEVAKATEPKTEITPERAMAALERILKADPAVLAEALAGMEHPKYQMEKSLMDGLKPSNDPQEQGRQKEILALIQNAIKDSSKSA